MRNPDHEKESRILDSTSDIIMNQGIAAVSLSKIAKEAGIASGSIYTYFKNKDDLLKRVYLNRKNRVAAAVTQIDLDGDPVVELGRLMDLVYQYGQKHLDDMLLIRQFNQSPVMAQLHIDASETYAGFEPLAELTQKGIDAGVFVPDVYPVIMSYAYTPALEYLLAVKNDEIDANKVPFANIKKLSLRAVVL